MKFYSLFVVVDAFFSAQYSYANALMVC